MQLKSSIFLQHESENFVEIERARDEFRAGKKDRFSLRADLDQTTGKLRWLQILSQERGNFIPFLNRTAVLMNESESAAQPTRGTSSGTDSATVPLVLTKLLNKLVLSQ